MRLLIGGLGAPAVADWEVNLYMRQKKTGVALIHHTSCGLRRGICATQRPRTRRQAGRETPQLVEDQSRSPGTRTSHQGNRLTKRRIHPMTRINALHTATATLSGIELVHMLYKGQARCGWTPCPELSNSTNWPLEWQTLLRTPINARGLTVNLRR